MFLTHLRVFAPYTAVPHKLPIKRSLYTNINQLAEGQMYKIHHLGVTWGVNMQVLIGILNEFLDIIIDNAI